MHTSKWTSPHSFQTLLRPPPSSPGVRNTKITPNYLTERKVTGDRFLCIVLRKAKARPLAPYDFSFNNLVSRNFLKDGKSHKNRSGVIGSGFLPGCWQIPSFSRKGLGWRNSKEFCLFFFYKNKYLWSFQDFYFSIIFGFQINKFTKFSQSSYRTRCIQH